MAKKLNWGSGIAIFYGVFFITVLLFVFYTFYLNWDLVTEDYYKKEITYQEQIDKKIRTEKLSKNIFINFLEKEKKIKIVFPEKFSDENMEGIILLYRPSNAALDKKIDLELNAQGMQTIDCKNLHPGNWRIKISWTFNNVQYYYEQQIIL